MRRLERIGCKPRPHSPVFRLNRGPRPGAGVLKTLRRQRRGGEPLGPALQRRHEILLVAPAAHDQALKPLLARHQKPGGDLSRPSGQHADQRDMPGHLRRRDGLRQRAGAADLDDVIRAAAPGQRAHPQIRIVPLNNPSYV